MAREISLEALAQSAQAPTSAPAKPASAAPHVGGSIKGAKPISVQQLGRKLEEQHPEIAAQREKERIGEDSPIVKNALDGMTSTLNKKKQDIIGAVSQLEKNAQEMALEKAAEEDPEATIDESGLPNDTSDLDDILGEDSAEPEIKYEQSTDHIKKEETPVKSETETEPNKVTKFQNKIAEQSLPEEDDDGDDLDQMLEDLDHGEDDTEDEEEDVEELRARFKESVNKNIKVIKNEINLSEFKIRSTPVSSSSVLSTINAKDVRKSADWVLFETGRSMTFGDCRGTELDDLRKTIQNSNLVNGVIASLRFVYNHTVDANKPSFEAWCKSIRTEDIESLYMGQYIACYADGNLLARACQKTKEHDGCGVTSLIPAEISDMVKIEDEDVKKKFYSILNHDTTTATTSIESTLFQISDDLVISYSSPTLFKTFLQYSTLKQEITEKYSDTLNMMAYIDGFFTIDRQNGDLVRINIKEYPNNFNKTVVSKLKVFVELLKTLTSDQYNVLVAKLDNIATTSKIKYVYPKTECPECGVEIPEEPIQSVLDLLFTRAQLVQVKSL